MDGIPHREVPPPQNRTRKNCRRTECFNVAFVVRSAPRRVPIRTKGLTASALAAKFRDEFETVRCEGGWAREIRDKSQSKSRYSRAANRASSIEITAKKNTAVEQCNVEQVMAFWIRACLVVRECASVCLSVCVCVYIYVCVQSKRMRPKAHL